jgi:hypothetical protein
MRNSGVELSQTQVWSLLKQSLESTVFLHHVVFHVGGEITDSAAVLKHGEVAITVQTGQESSGSESYYEVHVGRLIR